MTRVSLQMISLGSLLLFNQRASPSSSAANRSVCLSLEQLNIRERRFGRMWWNQRTLHASAPHQQRVRTCALAADETHGEESRSLSPWMYRVNHDIHRFPFEIVIAECLCQGCIINQREDLSHNSVPVFALLKILRKAQCPHDPNKYVVKKDFIRIPVACTCVVPKYKA